MQSKMMSEKEYQKQITALDKNIQKTESELGKLGEKLKGLKKQRDDLKNQYSLEKIRNSRNAKEWTAPFSWSERLTRVLKQKFKFNAFRGKQLAAINATLSKKDVLVLMPSGGGKSLIYQLPAVLEKGITLVISPLIALIDDQITNLSKLNIKAATINSSSTSEEKQALYKDMLLENSGLKLIYVTPEWVSNSKVFMSNVQKCFKQGNLKRIVIDEVHCCSTWGHDFRRDYTFLGFFKTMFPGVPILGLTATATVQVLADIQNILELKDTVIITSPFNRPNLYYKVTDKDLDKNASIDYVAKLLKGKFKGQSGLIYTTNAKETEYVANYLKEKGLKVKYYHSQLDAEVKKLVHQRWVSGYYQALVATVAFGMGIDKPDVRFVIHHSVPHSLEGLYQESGRAGRDGNKADCILMFNLADLLKNLSYANSPTQEKNCMAVLKYAVEQKRCRRVLLAEHFEDKLESNVCDKMCDNCKNSHDMTDYVITSAVTDIFRLLDVGKDDDLDVTLNKLMKGWFQTGPKTLRVPLMAKPTCSAQQAEYIIAYLISREYLKVTKGFSAYANLAYIKKGNLEAGQEVLMPYNGALDYPKGKSEATGTASSEDSIDIPLGPPVKRKKMILTLP